MIESPHKIIEVMLPSPAGELEALLMLPVPEPPEPAGAAIICHPHPLYGGSMHTKAVFAASMAFLSLGIPSLRFNFRGVGKSSGKYDNGVGEQVDARAAINYIAGKYPDERIITAGHSFGAWMAMKLGCMDPRVKIMIGIGTPVNGSEIRSDFLSGCRKPRLFIHGTLDKLIPIGNVEELYSNIPGPKKFVKIEGADHFFTGKLDELSEVIQYMVKEYISEKGT